MFGDTSFWNDRYCPHAIVFLRPYEDADIRKLMNGLKNKYIGAIIREKVDELGISYTEFARRINCARTSLYNIFNSKSIDVERLIQISQVLQFDFIHEVYLKDSSIENIPYIKIPFKNGKVDTSDLPEEIIDLFRKELVIRK